MYCIVWDKITHQFQTLTVDVWEWISKFFSLYIMDVITYLCWREIQTLLIKGTAGERTSCCSQNIIMLLEISNIMIYDIERSWGDFKTVKIFDYMARRKQRLHLRRTQTQSIQYNRFSIYRDRIWYCTDYERKKATFCSWYKFTNNTRCLALASARVIERLFDPLEKIYREISIIHCIHHNYTGFIRQDPRNLYLFKLFNWFTGSAERTTRCSCCYIISGGVYIFCVTVSRNSYTMDVTETKLTLISIHFKFYWHKGIYANPSCRFNQYILHTPN